MPDAHGPMGARWDDDDPVQQALALVHARLEALSAYHDANTLNAYHDADALPPGYSKEFDALSCAYRDLHRAVDARDAEAWMELSPFATRRREEPQ